MGPIGNASSWVGHGETPALLWCLLYTAGSTGTAYAYGRLLGLPEQKGSDAFSPAGWVCFVGMIWPVGLPAILAVWAAMRGEQDRKAGP